MPKKKPGGAKPEEVVDGPSVQTPDAVRKWVADRLETLHREAVDALNSHIHLAVIAGSDPLVIAERDIFKGVEQAISSAHIAMQRKMLVAACEKSGWSVRMTHSSAVTSYHLTPK